jgi:hypothetical protein
MRSNVAGLCARVGIATLAALAVVAVPTSAAWAAPSQGIAVAHGVSTAKYCTNAGPGVTHEQQSCESVHPFARTRGNPFRTSL